jgi:HD-GYP domain-containing protein (c-di-GMP phosphodiesterase class II)
MRRIDAGTERRLTDGFARTMRAPASREVFGHGLFTVLFLLAAGALALLAPEGRPVPVWLAAAFVLALAVTARVEFSTGVGYTVPTQVVVVPMLLLLPTPVVPLLVGLGLLLAAIIDGVLGRSAIARAPLAIADAWHSIAPAVVLVLLGGESPAWSRWPVYVAALAAHLGSDGLVALLRMRLAVGAGPRELAAEIRHAWRIDVLLAPIGFLAAMAAAPEPAAALLVLPLVLFVSVLAREREDRIAHSLELGRAYRGTALLLRDVLEDDDEYTGRHTEDVVGLSLQVAERMGLDEDVRRSAELGALLHDIGKIAIPDSIINKPGPLDDGEWAIMKTHTIEGQRMLDRVGGLLGDVGVVVRASHERYDGGGYPDGLAGDAIPLASRIVSACDAYNAMTTDRSYRRALPLEVAARELRANAGTQFDPDVVTALLDVVGAPQEPLAWEVVLGTTPAAAAPAPAPSRPRARSGPQPAP